MLFQPTVFQIIFSYPSNVTPIDTFHDPSFIRTTSSWKIIPPKPQVTPSHWKEYVSNLPAWDSILIHDHFPIWETEFLQKLQQGAPLVICSDGGAAALSGSYAAAIASDNKILIAICGRAFGLLPRYFRSETYGILALLQYILHRTIFHNYTFKSHVEL